MPHPPVYGGYTQAALDAQYDQRSAVPNASDYAERWQEQSAATRRARRFSTCAYGPSEAERIDLFDIAVPGKEGGSGGPFSGGTVAGGPPAVHLHVHGGAWRGLSRQAASFVCEGLAGPDCRVAVAGFALATAVPLDEMVAQIRRAFLWLRRWAGPDGPAVSVSGHSSGGHLAACLLDRVWWESEGLGASDFAGCVLASGIYDLEPVRLSARNRYLQLSRDDVERLSPLRRLPDRLPPLMVLWGDGELDEFRRQSRALAAAARPRCADLRALEVPGTNHFDVYDLFGDPRSPVARFVHALAPAASKVNSRGHQGEWT